eukprot:CAMPEP_0119077558 /NCGR_PEP_ID=MMETSP1178-20130426/95549_1 /TAXON_ID=33656 /ORGANISM="unid sp, Strain CCMP2000" /LENGTH=205 /DNA_ID=CAMNT_0007059929 /DNA_START=54 /DNA_END=670 /DNA_ORIENTATION=-
MTASSRFSALRAEPPSSVATVVRLPTTDHAIDGESAQAPGRVVGVAHEQVEVEHGIAVGEQRGIEAKGRRTCPREVGAKQHEAAPASMREEEAIVPLERRVTRGGELIAQQHRAKAGDIDAQQHRAEDLRPVKSAHGVEDTPAAREHERCATRLVEEADEQREPLHGLMQYEVALETAAASSAAAGNAGPARPRASVRASVRPFG